MPSGRSVASATSRKKALDITLRRADIGRRRQDRAVGAVVLGENATLAMVASVLLPVQPKKTGNLRRLHLGALNDDFLLLSGASIEVSPVEPMMSTADVPLSSWNLRSERNATKSTDPSLLKGVMRATNDPVSSFLDIAICCLREGNRRELILKFCLDMT